MLDVKILGNFIWSIIANRLFYDLPVNEHFNLAIFWFVLSLFGPI